MGDLGTKTAQRIALALDAAIQAAQVAALKYAAPHESIGVGARPEVSTTGGDSFGPLILEFMPGLERIALRHRFQADEVIGDEYSDEVRRALRTRLLPYCLVVTEGGQRLWSLRIDARRTLLQTLETFGRLRNAIIQAKESKDEKAQWVACVIDQVTPKIEEQSAVQLQMTLLASQWCDGIVRGVPSLSAVERRLALIRLLEPLAHLIHRQSGPFGTVQPDGFVGRTAELANLRDYVGVIASGAWISVRRLARSAGIRRNGPIVITGIGGIGKSTLVAKLLIDHSSVEPALRFPFAYLDFDRPGIIATEPVNLLIEMTRQLGWQFEALDKPLAQLRNDLRREAVSANTPSLGSATTSGSPSIMAEAQALSSGLNRLCGIIREAKLDDRPLLLVCDTFEEVQARLDNGVERVAALIAQLTEELPMMRTIISGRDEHLEKLGRMVKIDRVLPLKYLDEDAAMSLVASEGIDTAVAKEVIAVAGKSPLTLRLASQLVNEFGPDAIKPGILDSIWQKFSSQARDAYLYNRVLSHIGDPTLRMLANPGLLLRVITREVVQTVMGPARDMEIGDKQAENVFESLRATGWLLEGGTEGEVLRHRTELRKACIPLISEAEPGMSKRLHSLAADYYRSRMQRDVDDANRVEWAYHELATGRDLESVDREWNDILASSLGGTIDELNGGGRAYLKARANQPLTPDELALLPERMWRECVQAAVNQLLASYRVEEAASILFDKRRTLNDAAVITLGAIVADRNGDWSAAIARWKDALAIEKKDVGVLLQAAESASRAESGEAGAKLYSKVFGRSRAQHSDRIRASIGLSLSNRLTFVERAGELPPGTRLDRMYRGDSLSLDALEYFHLAIVQPPDQETMRDLIMLAPPSVSVDKLMVEALRSGELPWLTNAQIDALCDPARSFSIANGRQWLADLAVLESESDDVDFADRSERGKALVQFVNERGPEAVELLRPYFRNPSPQWYIPLARWLLDEMGQSATLKNLLADTGQRANVPEFQGDPLVRAPDGSLRLLVLLLEFLDRRGFLAPFLSEAAKLIGTVSPAFAAHCSRFNQWLTALTGEAPPTPSDPLAERMGASRRPAAKPKKRAAPRRMYR